MQKVERQKSYSISQLIGLILGIIAFISINNIFVIEGLSFEGKGVLATLALMAIWWNCYSR